MMTTSRCDCLVCRLEASLIAELNDDRNKEEFRLFAVASPILSSFPTACELIQQLHSNDRREESLNGDAVLFELLGRSNDTLFRPMGQRLLLLVFVPTVHRTTSQVAGTFPSLTRDDTAQHLFTVLLEFLHSKELRSRHSHLAFTVARRLRRSAFRWAIREARRSLRDDADAAPMDSVESDGGNDFSHSHILLERFLDNCQHRGWLSANERELLTQFKLAGISGPELASRNGHSAVAIRHRVQRLLGRLRRIARTSKNETPDQRNLFGP